MQLYLRCPFDRGPLWSGGPATAWLLVADGIVRALDYARYMPRLAGRAALFLVIAL